MTDAYPGNRAHDSNSIPVAVFTDKRHKLDVPVKSPGARKQQTIMKRRHFLKSLGLLGLTSACGFTEQGVWNPCLRRVPAKWADHDVVRAAWEGLDPTDVWDCHVHLVGTGDAGTGVYVNPNMYDATHLTQYISRAFYMNAACVEETEVLDTGFVERLIELHQDYDHGAKFMLLAFDYFYTEKGEPVPEKSTFRVPNHWAARVAAANPDRFEWIASIHPYRADAVEQLDAAVATGARAVKWLPPAMGIDPGSALCDDFYEALVRHDLPLLVHAGEEKAVESDDTQHLGNPLYLRRPLEHKVRVIACHCASLGQSVDTDKGQNGPLVDNFDLFARLMDEPEHHGYIMGDISAMTQNNRLAEPLTRVIERTDWHGRLLNGSDYPLVGVMPLITPTSLLNAGLIDDDVATVASAIRPYNPMLFDFVIKRSVRVGDKRLSNSVFETRRVFDRV